MGKREALMQHFPFSAFGCCHVYPAINLASSEALPMSSGKALAFRPCSSIAASRSSSLACSVGSDTATFEGRASFSTSSGLIQAILFNSLLLSINFPGTKPGIYIIIARIYTFVNSDPRHLFQSYLKEKQCRRGASLLCCWRMRVLMVITRCFAG